MHLGEFPLPDAQPEASGKPVAGHTRRTPRTDFAHDIGIGAVSLAGRSPPTPPGMRVRTGRFEQLRS